MYYKYNKSLWLFLLLIFLGVGNMQMFAMKGGQFIKSLAQPFHVERQIENNIDVEISDDDLEIAKTHLLGVMKLQSEIPPDILFGWCWFELGNLLEFKIPVHAVTCFQIAANFGLTQAKIKFAELVLQRFPEDFKSLKLSAIGHMGQLATGIDRKTIAIHPIFAVSVFKIMGSYYCGEGDLAKAGDCFKKAKQLIDEQIKLYLTISDVDYKGWLAVQKEQVERFIERLSDF